jgi:hypothetical protein
MQTCTRESVLEMEKNGMDYIVGIKPTAFADGLMWEGMDRD